MSYTTQNIWLAGWLVSQGVPLLRVVKDQWLSSWVFRDEGQVSDLVEQFNTDQELRQYIDGCQAVRRALRAS